MARPRSPGITIANMNNWNHSHNSDSFQPLRLPPLKFNSMESLSNSNLQCVLPPISSPSRIPSSRTMNPNIPETNPKSNIPQDSSFEPQSYAPISRPVSDQQPLEPRTASPSGSSLERVLCTPLKPTRNFSSSSIISGKEEGSKQQSGQKNRVGLDSTDSRETSENIASTPPDVSYFSSNPSSPIRDSLAHHRTYSQRDLRTSDENPHMKQEQKNLDLHHLPRPDSNVELQASQALTNSQMSLKQITMQQPSSTHIQQIPQQHVISQPVLQHSMPSHPIASSAASPQMMHSQMHSAPGMETSQPMLLQTSPANIQHRSAEYIPQLAPQPATQVHPPPMMYSSTAHYTPAPITLSMNAYPGPTSSPILSYGPYTPAGMNTTHAVAPTPTNSWGSPMVMPTHAIPYTATATTAYRTDAYGTTWSYPSAQGAIPRGPVKKTLATPRGLREVYACPFDNCERVSTEHSNMKAHMRMHTGERPYVCRHAGCMKTFRWKSSLTYHERALHTKARPYKCGPCRKSFVEKRKLRMHYDLCPAVRQLGGMIPDDSISAEPNNGSILQHPFGSSGNNSGLTGMKTDNNSIPHVIKSNSNSTLGSIALKQRGKV